MPEGQTVTEAQIESARSAYQSAQNVENDARYKLNNYEENLDELRLWFDSGNCKWKPGRYWGKPIQRSHEPTSAAHTDCGWKKDWWFNARDTWIPNAKNALATAEITTDDLREVLNTLIETAEREAVLDPGYLETQAQLAAQTAEAKDAQKQKTTRYIIAGVIIIVVILITLWGLKKFKFI